MITIKDYAKQKGVSYEAIRKQIKRYEPSASWTANVRKIRSSSMNRIKMKNWNNCAMKTRCC